MLLPMMSNRKWDWLNSAFFFNHSFSLLGRLFSQFKIPLNKESVLKVLKVLIILPPQFFSYFFSNKRNRI